MKLTPNKGGRPKPPLTLSDDERQKLQAWAPRPTSTQRLASRAKIILACAEGLDNKAVAARLRVNLVTVGKWRKRFPGDRLEGLTDDPPGHHGLGPDEAVAEDAEHAETGHPHPAAVGRRLGDLARAPCTPHAGVPLRATTNRTTTVTPVWDAPCTVRRVRSEHRVSRTWDGPPRMDG